MIKKLLILLSLCSAFVCTSVSYAEDDMDFDEFAVVDDEGEDMNTESVSLNDGDGPVDVKQFDIAGIMLGMGYEEINNLFFENPSLYAPRRKNSVIYTINQDWKYNLDYECRQNNVFLPEKLEKCIYSLARNRGLLYVSEVHLVRDFTGETIDVYFTSNATDNKVWKVVYNNDVNKVDGPSAVYANQREKKILAFWQSVVSKYGMPNSEEDKWISSENAYDPMMRAYYGQLVLTDKGLNATDSAKNIQAAREKFQAKPYAF